MALRARPLVVLLASVALTAPVVLLTPLTATATVTVVETEESSVQLRHLPAGTARTVELGRPAHDVAVHWRGSPGARVSIRLAGHTADVPPHPAAHRPPHRRGERRP